MATVRNTVFTMKCTEHTKKFLCEFKDQTRARLPVGKCGLLLHQYSLDGVLVFISVTTAVDLVD